MPNLTGFHLNVLFCSLTALMLFAPPQLAYSQDPVRLTLTIEPNAIRFSTPAGDVLDWRLEVVDQQDRAIFDSSFVAGSSLTWALVNSVAQGVESGVYAYTLSIRGAGPMRSRRGELLVQRTTGGYQVWAISDRQAALGTNGETLVTVTENVDASIAGADAPVGPATAEPPSRSLPTSLGSLAFPGTTPYISGSGTTNRVTKWADGPTGVVGDTEMSEASGQLVVGNASFTGNVQIFGPANNDVFAGMGPNIVTGPAFNFGYGGATFGRSAGFFNVRPDGTATPPNPSLRFMTNNLQRMIVTNTGDIGIGTTAPDRDLTIQRPNAAYLNVRSTSGMGPQEILVGADAGGGIVSTMTNHDLALRAGGNSTKILIKANGIVGIGTTNPSYGKLEVFTDTGLGAAVFGVSTNGNGVQGNSTNAAGVVGNSTNGFAGLFYGDVYATGTITQNSDARLKQDLTNLRYGLHEVVQLRPVTWIWKDRPDRGRQLGLVAQDVEQIVPELVTRGKDDAQTLGLNYIGLVPVVIRAIQEQQVTIQEQRAAINRLTSENAALEARLTALERLLKQTKRTKPSNR